MTIAIALAAASLLLMLGGGLGMLRANARVRRRRGAEVEREAIARRMSEPESPGEVASASASTFRGKAASVEAEASIDMAEFKRLLRAREWRRVLPSLLMIAGMLGFMTFGAIALTLLLDQPVTGLLMLGVTAYAVVRILRDYRNA
jgi:hypothetical protein